MKRTGNAAMKFSEALKNGSDALMAADISDAALDAWYLLSFVTGLTKQQYYLSMTSEMEESVYKTYIELVEQRAKHVPLQHLTHEQEFMGLSFYVDENVLIPRQDTEVLVETALKLLNEADSVLDLCTGSGCIVLSLIHHGKNIKGTGSDISGKALEVAKKNAKSLGLEVSFNQGDLFEGIKGSYDMIVSNPPYIATAEIAKLQEEVRLHDPLIALDGHEDGLIFYKRITAKAPSFLKSGGWLIYEIGYDQGEAVSTLMKDNGFTQVEVIKDLCGLDRVVKGKYHV